MIPYCSFIKSGCLKLYNIRARLIFIDDYKVIDLAIHIHTYLYGFPDTYIHTYICIHDLGIFTHN